MKRKVSCKKYKKLFSKFIDNELSISEDIFVREHLDQCKRCKEDVDGMRKIKEMLLSLPEIYPSPNFDMSLQNRLSKLERRRHRFAHVVKYVAIYASIACLISVLSFTTYVLNEGTDDHETYVPQEEMYISLTLDNDDASVTNFVMPIVHSGTTDDTEGKLGGVTLTCPSGVESHYVLEHVLITNVEQGRVWR